IVNTRTDADLSAAVQNALQTLLPQIRAEIREEFRTSSGPLDTGGNPPPALPTRCLICHVHGTYGVATDYGIMKEGMSILRGRKSVPGINSRERGIGKKRTTMSSRELHDKELV
nr:hypothetical protein [Tanacetum cinerariifolium]